MTLMLAVSLTLFIGIGEFKRVLLANQSFGKVRVGYDWVPDEVKLMILCFGTTPAISRTMRFRELQVGGVNRAIEVYTYAAGKAVNVARAVQTLAEEALCVGVEGGMIGSHLLALLERDRLQHHFFHTVASTRLVLTVIDEARTTATELIEDAPPMTAEEGEHLLGDFVDALQTARVAVLSGSLARGLSHDYYALCIERAREEGVRTVLDASGEPLQQGTAARPDVIKVNADELASLEGRVGFEDESQLLDAVRSVARQSEGCVIVTRGQQSTIAADAAGQCFRVDPVPVDRIVSPIGSGDSFAAGVATALSRGGGVAEMLTLGTACAVANVQTPHAAHFDLEAVRKYCERVNVTAM